MTTIILTAEEKTEGLTAQFVNDCDFETKRSPALILLNQSEMVVTLVPNSKGYWITMDGINYWKGDKGQLLVINQRTAQVARARYLHKYADKERAEVLQSYKSEVIRLCFRVLKKFKNTIDHIERMIYFHDTHNMQLVDAYGSSELRLHTGYTVKGDFIKDTAKYREQLPGLISTYRFLEQLDQDNKFETLAELCKVIEPENPIFITPISDIDGWQAIMQRIFNLKTLNWDDLNLLTIKDRVEKLKANA